MVNAAFAHRATFEAVGVVTLCRRSHNPYIKRGMSMIRCHAPFILAVCGAAASVAAQTQHPTPNVINTPGPVVSSLNGTQFVNHGLVGVGRIPAFLDSQGSTFGSVSSLAIAPGTWGFDPASGRYSGQFLTLPDRGRNDPVSGNFVNYQGRVQKLDFNFTPLATG